MRKDTQTVPVIVVVPARSHGPGAHAPGSSLPFTGAPLEALTAWGVVIAVAGAAVVTTGRRRRLSSRSPR